MFKRIAQVLAVAVATAGTAFAQYPNKPVTLMVPYAPGPTDTVARIMAQAKIGRAHV